MNKEEIKKEVVEKYYSFITSNQINEEEIYSIVYNFIEDHWGEPLEHLSHGKELQKILQKVVNREQERVLKAKKRGLFW